MRKAGQSRRRHLANREEVGGIDAEIVPPTELELDRHDASAGFARKVGMVWMDDANGSDEGASYDPASMFDYRAAISKADRDWMRTLQVHVLYLALGYVLTDRSVPAERREMLRLRYGKGMTVQEIMALPRFAGKARGTFDVQMSRATADLRKEVADWWKLVSPDENDFADETILRLWREFGGTDERAQLSNDLQDRAIKIAGPVK